MDTISGAIAQREGGEVKQKKGRKPLPSDQAEVQKFVRDSLFALTDLLPEKDRDFATSLISGYDTYGSLSYKQLFHAMRLVFIATMAKGS